MNKHPTLREELGLDRPWARRAFQGFMLAYTFAVLSVALFGWELLQPVLIKVLASLHLLLG